MHKQDHLASVNRQHELYTGFEAAGQASAQVHPRSPPSVKLRALFVLHRACQAATTMD